MNTIRDATPYDAPYAIPHIYEAGGSIANTLAGADNGDEVMRILEEFFRQEGNRLSYRNTLVAERDRRVVGALVSYPGSLSDMLDRPFRDRRRAQVGGMVRQIERETRDDEYYLDSLGVAEAHRGTGIATALIAAFEARAREESHSTVALLAEESNAPAFRLYRKLGYQTDEIVRVYGYEFHHMVKRLTHAG